VFKANNSKIYYSRQVSQFGCLENSGIGSKRQLYLGRFFYG